MKILIIRIVAGILFLGPLFVQINPMLSIVLRIIGIVLLAYDLFFPKEESIYSKLSENKLIRLAEQSPNDDFANRAMAELRRRFDHTYFWCEDCDGLVCKKKDCCLNK